MKWSRRAATATTALEVLLLALGGQYTKGQTSCSVEEYFDADEASGVTDTARGYFEEQPAFVCDDGAFVEGRKVTCLVVQKKTGTRE